MKKRILKILVFKVKVKNNLFYPNFETVLSELNSRLDDDNRNRRVLDIYNDVETSIWFDSFDYESNFKDNIFKNTICFLLAKDANISMVEDKENNEIKSSKEELKEVPKIPAHCVYLKDKNILLMEELNGGPTIKTLERGVAKHLGLKKKDLEFKIIYRDDALERLRIFVDKIEEISLEDVNIIKYIKDIDDDSENSKLYNFLKNPKTKIKAKLTIESDDFKTKAVQLFEYYFNNRATKELENIKIVYKNEDEQNEVIELYNNLLSLKIGVDIYYDNIENNDDRVDYSMEIYKSIIKKYFDEDKKSI